MKLLRQAQSGKKKIPSLWETRSMPRSQAASLLKSLVSKGEVNVDRLLDSVYALPLISVDNVKLSHEVEKGTGKSTGKLHLDLGVHCDGRQKKGDGDPLTLTLALGTPQQRRLVAHHTMAISRNKVMKKSVDLSFDWSAANADAGESGGTLILRVLIEEIRGLDSELVLRLRETSQN